MRKNTVIYFKNEILNYLKDRKEYTTIDDMRIDLMVRNVKNFDIAWEILLIEDRLEIIGNSIKIIKK